MRSSVSPKKNRSIAAHALTMLSLGTLMLVGLIFSPPLPAKVLPQEQSTQETGESSANVQMAQPVIVNGRAIYAVPVVNGPETIAILQTVDVDDIAYVVYDFPGWGKSVSTSVHWFRCVDIMDVNQYRGSQIEMEAWFLLTEQARLEVQAACTWN